MGPAAATDGPLHRILQHKGLMQQDRTWAQAAYAHFAMDTRRRLRRNYRFTPPHWRRRRLPSQLPVLVAGRVIGIRAVLADVPLLQGSPDAINLAPTAPTPNLHIPRPPPRSPRVIEAMPKPYCPSEAPSVNHASAQARNKGLTLTPQPGPRNITLRQGITAPIARRRLTHSRERGGGPPYRL